MADNSDHYSYSEYRKQEIAEGFEELRFGGPVGAMLRNYQDDQLQRWIPSPKGRKILDIGAGTGRTAIPLAMAGADVIAADASDAMLQVARKNAEYINVELDYKVCDIMDLPFQDGQFDSILCYRVLMHVVDWKKAVAEMCRCASEEIILDYPSLVSLAALQGPARNILKIFNKEVQNFRHFTLGQVREEFARHGWKVVQKEKLWFMPIAFHKVFKSAGFTKVLEGFFRITGLTWIFGSPVTIHLKKDSGTGEA